MTPSSRRTIPGCLLGLLIAGCVGDSEIPPGSTRSIAGAEKEKAEGRGPWEAPLPPPAPTPPARAGDKIKVCDPATKAVVTLVGAHERGATDDPPRFDEPGGLALVGDSLYVADTNNHAIRVVDPMSKQVRTLDTASIKPPTQIRTPRFVNARLIDARPATARPAATLDLEVALPIPDGSKLGAEAPLVTLVETNPSEALAAEVRGVAREVERPTATFRLAVPLARAPASGSTVEVKVSASAFVCLPNSLCTLRSFVWTVAVTFRDDAPGAGPIRLDAPAP